jgi:hypothetical protein
MQSLVRDLFNRETAADAAAVLEPEMRLIPFYGAARRAQSNGHPTGQILPALNINCRDTAESVRLLACGT